MIHIIYETRIIEDMKSKTVRCSETVTESDVDLNRSLLRGVPIVIVSCERIPDIKIAEPVPVIKRPERRCFKALKQKIYHHFRNSSWNKLVYILVDDFIKDLEWEEILKQAGYKTKSFPTIWGRFKDVYVKELAWSPKTQKMIERLEKQDWLRDYLDEDDHRHA